MARVVSSSGFSGLTDALGGVRVDDAVAFRNLGRAIPRGPIVLDGDRAPASVRARHPFAGGDFQRVQNQRAYLQAVVRQLRSRGTLLNPGRLQSSVTAIAPYLLVDEGLDSRYLGGLALRLRGLRGDGLVGFTVPTAGTGMEGDQSVVRLDDDAVADLARHLRDDTMDAFDRCSVSVC